MASTMRPLALWFGATLFATTAARLALPAAFAAEGRSNAEIGAVVAAATMAWPLFGLLAGVMLDRDVRGRGLVLGQLLLLAAVGALLALTGATLPDTVVACGLIFLVGCVEVLAEVGGTALTPRHAGGAERLGRANSLMVGVRIAALGLLGPYLAAQAAANDTATVLWIALAAAAAALPALARLRHGPAATAPVVGVPRALGAGLGALRRSATLMLLTGSLWLMMLCWSAWYALVAPHLLAASGGEATLGVVLAAVGLGGIAAAPLVPAAQRVLGVRRTLLLDLIGTVAMVGVPAATRDPVAIAFGAALSGAGSVFWTATVMTLMQRRLPPDLLGRTTAAYRWIGWMSLPLGGLAAGLLADAIGTGGAFRAFGGIALLATALFMALARERDLSIAPAASSAT